MKRERSKVILVGAGPGDPELITVKGMNAVTAADVVIYDYLANDKLLACCKPDVEKIYVGKQAGKHSLRQDEINELLIAKAQEHKVIVRLKGGDPFVFGRGGEEILALSENNIEFEVVPGVTSGIAALTYAGIPATHRGDATSVSFITGHEDPTKPESGLNWPAIAAMDGTLVFYMGIRNLPSIIKNLIENGKSPKTPVALVRWGTLPKQQTLVGAMETIVQQTEAAGFRPPALIVVGDVIRHREVMNWFERKPFNGKRMVNTRARAQSSDLTQQLADLGADVIEFPTIRIEPPALWQPLDEAIRHLDRYKWIIFTSVNGVEYFHNRFSALGLKLPLPNTAKIAAIGPATSKRLRDYGVTPDVQPDKFVAEALLEALQRHSDISGSRILLPRAQDARSILVDELTSSGAVVDNIDAYRTVVEDEHQATIIEQLQHGKIDAVTFTSSSTVSNFVKLIGAPNVHLVNNCTVACIGPITADTARSYDMNVNVVPDEYTIPGLVDAIVAYYS